MHPFEVIGPCGALYEYTPAHWAQHYSTYLRVLLAACQDIIQICRQYTPILPVFYKQKQIVSVLCCAPATVGEYTGVFSLRRVDLYLW